MDRAGRVLSCHRDRHQSHDARPGEPDGTRPQIIRCKIVRRRDWQRSLQQRNRFRRTRSQSIERCSVEGRWLLEQSIAFGSVCIPEQRGYIFDRRRSREIDGVMSAVEVRAVVNERDARLEYRLAPSQTTRGRLGRISTRDFALLESLDVVAVVATRARLAGHGLRPQLTTTRVRVERRE